MERNEHVHSTCPLTDNQISHWKEKGYVVVSGLIEPDIITACTDKIQEVFQDKACQDFGSDGLCEFPTCSCLDEVTVHEVLIDAVSQLLDTPDILLTQSDAWCKAGHANFGGQQNNDQRFHMDYGNNTFLHPTPWHSPENVAAIVYLADTEETGGGTAVCPREGSDDPAYQTPYINMPGQGGFWEFYNDRTSAERYFRENHPEVAEFRQQLYNREIIPVYKPGDVLLYRYDVWHRGTPVNLGHKRSVINIAWKKRDSFWHLTWNPAWSKWNYYGKTERVLMDMSPKQRSLVGVPKPGHQYWDEEKVTMFAARYPGMDVTPYLEAL